MRANKFEWVRLTGYDGWYCVVEIANDYIMVFSRTKGHMMIHTRFIEEVRKSDELSEREKNGK